MNSTLNPIKEELSPSITNNSLCVDSVIEEYRIRLSTQYK